MVELVLGRGGGNGKSFPSGEMRLKKRKPVVGEGILRVGSAGGSFPLGQRRALAARQQCWILHGLEFRVLIRQALQLRLQWLI